MDKDINLVQMHTGDYGSEFEYDSEADRARARRQDLAHKAKPSRDKVASSHEVTEEYNKEEGRKMRFHILSMDAFARHKKFINDYLMYFGGSKKEFQRDTSRDKTDLDVIRENHRFLWSEDDNPNETWEKQLSKRYYDKLYKEYCITDLSRYKENKIAMRWRVEKEVILGKGQFECGNKRCESTEGLRTWEVNFGYMEHGEKKNALVMLRLCPECSRKLNYHHKRREVTRGKKRHQSTKSGSKRQKTEDEDSIQASSSKSTEEKESVPQASRSDDTKSQENKSHDSKSHDSKPHDVSEEADTSGDPDNPWSGPVKVTAEKSREEEFEDYFEDMFL